MGVEELLPIMPTLDSTVSYCLDSLNYFIIQTKIGEELQVVSKANGKNIISFIMEVLRYY